MTNAQRYSWGFVLVGLFSLTPFAQAQGCISCNSDTGLGIMQQVFVPSKVPAENSAMDGLQKTLKNKKTTPDQIDAQVSAFQQKFPTSDILAPAISVALQYFQQPEHKNFDKSLQYGQDVLKADPNYIYALSTLGDIIPDNIRNVSDDDRDKLLDEAQQYDQSAIKLASNPKQLYAGKSLTDDQRKTAQAIAYTSLARIANIEDKYDDAVSAYQKAVTFDDKPHQAVDYYYMGLAQEHNADWKGADASMDKAGSLDPANTGLVAAVAKEKNKIKLALSN